MVALNCFSILLARCAVILALISVTSQSHQSVPMRPASSGGYDMTSMMQAAASMGYGSVPMRPTSSGVPGGIPMRPSSMGGYGDVPMRPASAGGPGGVPMRPASTGGYGAPPLNPVAPPSGGYGGVPMRPSSSGGNYGMAPTAVAPPPVDLKEKKECKDAFGLICLIWTIEGRCFKEPLYMLTGCKDSCGLCGKDATRLIVLSLLSRPSGGSPPTASPQPPAGIAGPPAPAAG